MKRSHRVVNKEELLEWIRSQMQIPAADVSVDNMDDGLKDYKDVKREKWLKTDLPTIEQETWSKTVLPTTERETWLKTDLPTMHVTSKHNSSQSADTNRSSWETVSSSSEDSEISTPNSVQFNISDKIDSSQKYKKFKKRPRKSKLIRFVPNPKKIHIADDSEVIYERCPSDIAIRKKMKLKIETDSTDSSSWESENSSNDSENARSNSVLVDIFDLINQGLYDKKYKKFLGKSGKSKMIRLAKDPPKIHIDNDIEVIYERCPSDDTIGVIEHEKKSMGYLRGPDVSKFFTFNGEESDDENIDTEGDDPSTEEKETIRNFIHFTINEKLSFKRTDEEVGQIKDAVFEAVTLLAKQIGTIVPFLEMSKIYSVGSMAEGTRLKEPDEFDYLIVIKPFWLKDNLKVESAFSELECECKSKRDFLSGTIYDPTIEEKKKKWSRHAHIKLINKSESKMFEKFYRYVTDPRENIERETIIIPIIQRQTGILKQNVYSLCRGIEDKELHGPAITFSFSWFPNDGFHVPLNLSVDFVFAIEVENVGAILQPHDVDISSYEKGLKEYNKYLLVPDFSTRFKFAFTHFEVNLMESLSSTHKMCYKFLKFLFECSFMHGRSYFLKTCLLRHAAECEGQDDIYLCIKKTLSQMNVEKRGCKFSVRSLFLSDMRINFYIGIGNALKHKKRLLDRVKSAGRLKRSDFDDYLKEIAETPIYDNYVNSSEYIPSSPRYTLR